MDNMTEQKLHTLRVLLRSHQLMMRALKQDMRTYGLTENEFMILEYLLNKGPHVVQDIKEHLLIPNSSVTYVIDCLEGKGLVKRERSSKDMRRIIIALTPKGQRKIAADYEEHKDYVNQLFSVLDADELKRLRLIHKKLGFQAEEYYKRDQK
ncbi:hypothetical protein HMPREF2626_04275 [Aerococcus sp. HMSC062A02]|nr:MarR family transcriptional regulator [Aerococcus sanguinicola]OFN05278.1 hypothetical protein HMPREF2626_04275 [Aerococcus sp. HMSC062A02]OHO43404.1 hypothetical protein HMPREF2705_07880 [Aerococcus sp. HMSC035B07]